MRYDPHDRCFLIVSERLEHCIAEPQQIYVIEERGQPSCLEIVDAEGRKQIVA